MPFPSVELVMNSLLLAAYVVASASCFAISSRLYGSLLSGKFTALGLVWLVGLISLALDIISRLLDLSFLPIGDAVRLTLRLLSFYLPPVATSLVLAHMAILYSRYARGPRQQEVV